jgi:hypothetical protein
VKASNSSNYLIRLCDQTGPNMKMSYGCLSEEQFKEINKILESTKDDWED